ncbi:TPA: hypothetical protein ACGH3C_002241 [Salmonella enterica subsp. enterica serovar Javiana]
MQDIAGGTGIKDVSLELLVPWKKELIFAALDNDDFIIIRRVMTYVFFFDE